MRFSSALIIAFKRLKSGKDRCLTSSMTVCKRMIGGVNKLDSIRSIWARKTFVSGRIKWPLGYSLCVLSPEEDRSSSFVLGQRLHRSTPHATSSRRYLSRRTVRCELMNDKGVEILTFDNLPSGRLLEELALSNYRLWPRSFPDSNFDHIDRGKKYFASGNPRNASFTSTKTVPDSKSLHDLEGLVRAPVSITCSPEIFQWLQTNFNYPLLIHIFIFKI